MTFNYVDIAVILILILSVYNTRHRGFTHLIVSLLNKLISIGASVSFCGKVSHHLRQTPLFDIIKAQVDSFLKIENFIDTTKLTAPQIIDKSSISDTLFKQLIANDNSEIYKLFKVETYTDYVSSYIANITINIISVVLVYFVSSMLIKTLFKANRIISRFPIIKQLNSFASLVGGFIEGVIVVWILMIVLMFFVFQGMFTEVYDMLLTSKVAIYFLEYNIFAKIIFEVMP